MKKLTNKLICIDIETTDLNSDAGSVIQIGAVKVTQEFKPKKFDSFMSYIKPLTKHRNLQAMACNTISENVLENAIELDEALEMFENYCGKNAVLCSWGITFDIIFLQKQYEKINRPWPFGYRHFDLRSIATWEFAKEDKTFTGGLYPSLKILNLQWEGTKHDALDDIINTTKILEEFVKRDNLAKLKKGW